ncbi:AraC family transcriptional regulator [Labrys miyagiensis]|uniref:AraC family transcriptional regulator n=1 Tax=Labrys miyagiensis TaxID=346912 RepID=A0ABQ6CFX6_9HYPH|nr:AraC family transcriptional regulator [Labrys miyagiensis]GLS19241.1 AraC family transcriptional regulator [Labrys miyagiensis]
MDALSDVLRVIHLKGGIFLKAVFTAPWCVSTQLRAEDCGLMLDGAEQLMLFHYVVEGRLMAQTPNGPPVQIEAGEVVILPHNHQHLLGSHLELAPVATKNIVQNSRDGGLHTIHHGGGGEQTRFVCGFLGCDRMSGNPLLDALPPLLRFDTRQGSVGAWMRSSVEFAAQEITSGRAGSETMLAKLSELLFVEAIRHYIEDAPDAQTGWLAGLKDPFVSRALSLLHGRVAGEWTVDELGREVGLSRSALADRFTRLIGEPPMRYLARWRIRVAANRLRNSEASLAQVAEEVGYESEAAFNRAFKRNFGVPPATWRRSLSASKSTLVRGG